MRKVLLFLATIIIFITPATTNAFPFGGQITDMNACANGVVYVFLGPPMGGPFVWSPTYTTTYPANRGPTHPSQWMVGIAGPNYFCIPVTLNTEGTKSGVLMALVGASE